MYSFSLFLRSEVNLLLNVVHSSLLSLEGFFSYACLRICLVLIDFRSAAVRYGNLFLYPIFTVFFRETVLKSVDELCVKSGK